MSTTTEETRVLPTTEELASQTYADGSKADSSRITAAISSFVAEMGPFWEASKTVAALRSKLADLLMEIRLSILLSSGKPDLYGQSKAYRTIFSDRVLGMLKETYEMPLGEAKALLDSVRVNYVNRNEMVAETVIREAVRRGEIKNAKVEPNGTVVVTTQKGNVQEYKPGQSSNVPAVIKAVVAKAQKDAGKKVPARFGGAEKDRNPAPEDGPENPGDSIREALALIVSMGAIAPLDAVEGFHSAATMLVDSLIGAPDVKGPTTLPGGKDKVALALLPIADLLKSASACIAGSGSKDAVAEYRYQASDS